MYTIFAQSSAPGKAGVSIFRISGKESLKVLRALTGKVEFTPRFLYKVDLKTPGNELTIDQAMAVYFKAPFSFTGEEVVEFYTHGSIAVAKLLTETILNFDNVVMAEAGEFTKRAVLNNKMDLTAAEGLVDLISAETIMQHKQAMRQMSGELDELYGSWRKQLLKIMSLLEAYIDFPDEEIPESALKDAQEIVKNIISKIQDHLNDNRRGERLREGLKLTIFGQPNVGKSSLLNLLVQKEVAIVSDIAGTTRDIIETHLDIGGYPLILTDTAGLREDTTDIIEQEGVRRAFKAIEVADIKICLCNIDNYKKYINMVDEQTIFVINKIDLLTPAEIKLLPQQFLALSLKNKTGFEELLSKIIEKAEEIARPSEQPTLTRARHRALLQKSLKALTRADLRADLVLAAEDVRIAARQLAIIIGKVEVEEILGEIFSNFCIGK